MYHDNYESARPLVEHGDQILGSILLARTGVFIDYAENPRPYDTVLRRVMGSLDAEPQATVRHIMNAVLDATNTFVPFSLSEYEAILKEQALLRGTTRLNTEHRVGLSVFVGRAGICQEYALFAGALLSLIKTHESETSAGALLTGDIAIRPTGKDLDDPNRHLAVYYTDPARNNGYVLELGQLEPQSWSGTLPQK